jgi:uncharacterized phage-associated protein
MVVPKENAMPGWSPEIANEFIRLAAADRRAFDQSQLQKLVYIAHGWCLAFFDQPLTGDRPEAWGFGPVFRRLADALAPYGSSCVIREIRKGEVFPGCNALDADLPIRSELDPKERDLIATIYHNYGQLEASQLSNWTRKGAAPWAQVFANGAGEFRDISHNLVKAQFVELLRHSGRSAREPVRR